MTNLDILDPDGPLHPLCGACGFFHAEGDCDLDPANIDPTYRVYDRRNRLTFPALTDCGFAIRVAVRFGGTVCGGRFGDLLPELPRSTPPRPRLFDEFDAEYHLTEGD